MEHGFIPLEKIEVASSESVRKRIAQEDSTSLMAARDFARVSPRKDSGTNLAANQPSVSVIIPYSKPNKIDNCIQSVLSQDYPKDLLEIVVVGKGSTSLADRFPRVVQIDEGPILQPGRARNLGAAKASGDVLIFLDDDCEAQPGWIEESVAELRNTRVGAVSGMISGKSHAFFARCIDYANFGQCQTDRRWEGRLWAATFGIRRDLFQQLGGFNEKVRVQEDIDLCFRLNRESYATVYQPKVKVLHNHGRTSLKSLIGYQYFGGRHAGLHVESQYPDLSFRNRLLAKLQNPLLYALFISPFAVAGTLSTVVMNYRDNKTVLLLLPFILLGKLSCHLGVWRWTWGRWTSGSPTLQGFIKLLRYSLLKTRFRTPRILTLFVTSQCNAKCSHCFYWENLNQGHDLSFDEIVKLSNSIGTLDKLLITGGEPFLRRDLADICQLFFEKNSLGDVSIPTNGLQPERTRTVVKGILEAANGRPVTISFSIDGTEEYHDRLRGVPGNLKKLQETYRQVRTLQDEFPNLILRVATTVMQQNYDEVMKLFDEMPNILPGVNSPCINLLRGSPHDRSLMLPSEADIKRLYEHKVSSSPGKQGFLRRLADRFTFAVAYENFRQDTQVVPCEAGRILGVVEDNGDVKPCELLPPVGNLREGTFEEIWNSAEAKEARQRIVDKQCKCTHECNTFPSLMANPLHAVKLAKTMRS